MKIVEFCTNKNEVISLFIIVSALAFGTCDYIKSFFDIGMVKTIYLFIFFPFLLFLISLKAKKYVFSLDKFLTFVNRNHIYYLNIWIRFLLIMFIIIITNQVLTQSFDHEWGFYFPISCYGIYLIMKHYHLEAFVNDYKKNMFEYSNYMFFYCIFVIFIMFANILSIVPGDTSDLFVLHMNNLVADHLLVYTFVFLFVGYIKKNQIK